MVAVGTSFIIVLMYYTLNEVESLQLPLAVDCDGAEQVARDLEDPFNFDPNELPLVVMVCGASLCTLL